MKNINYHYNKYSSRTMTRRINANKTKPSSKLTSTVKSVAKKTICTLAIASTLMSCKTSTIYVPLPTQSTQFTHHLQKDSITKYDSVFVAQKTIKDTLIITKEKYRYIYQDKFVYDTINKTDTISVMVPVVETKEVNKIYKWQQIMMTLGAIFVGWNIMKLLRKFI